MKQKTISEYLKERFGTKVYRLALTSGCTCPNRDGTISTGGCTFCSEQGSGEFAALFMPVREQIKAAKRLVDPKFPAGSRPEERRYIAYFQSFTNTYGRPEELRKIFLEAIEQPEIVILSIATRPDCLPPEILDMLEELGRIKPVWVELGLQTANEETARRINRGYALPVFEKAVQELRSRGIGVIVHIILGLPGETEEDMLGTVKYLSGIFEQESGAETDAMKQGASHTGIKLQELQILKGASMAEQFSREPFPVL